MAQVNLPFVMGKITKECIEQVVASTDIVDLISSYFPLKRAGTAWKALCPFHKEKSPSFTVNTQRQTYHCFGCGAGGNAIGFVVQYENLDFPSAVKKLAQRAGVAIVEESGGFGSAGESEHRAAEKARLLAMHRETADWFHLQLMKKPAAQNARDYLKSRGLNKEVAVRWKLGYAPESWDELLNFLKERGYTPEEIERSGLVSRKENSSDFYDRFRGRLMFPISNEMGEVIAFSGRVLDPDAKTAKYVNSPETPIFTKGRVLFGLDKTKRALIENNAAIVCEGQLDLITCYEAGIQNVLAPQGTAFTEQQARVVRRFAETVILCFDSDTAGMAAVERSLPALFGVGLDVRVAVMPEGEDPDSTIRKQGAEAFRQTLAGAKDFFDHALSLAIRQEPEMTPRSRATIAKRLAGFLAQIDDPALRDAHLQKLGIRLQLSPAMLGDLVNSALRKTSRQEEDTPLPPEPAALLLAPGEEILLQAALSGESVRHWLKEVNLEEAIPSARVRSLFEKLRDENFPEDDPQAFSRFLATLPPDVFSTVNTLELLANPDKALLVAKDCWNGMLSNLLKTRLESLKQRLKTPGLEIAESNAIQKEILDLTVRLKDIPRFSRWATLPP